MDRSSLKYFLRLIFGILILTYLFFIVDLEDFPGVSDVDLSPLALAIPLACLDRFLNAYRWNILVNTKNLGISFSEIAKIYFKSVFVGLIIPSSIGGELLKGYGLYKATSKGVDSVSSVIVERIFGFIALLSVCLGGFFIFRSVFKAIPNAVLIWSFCVAALALTLFVVFLGYFCFPFFSRMSLDKGGKIGLIINRVWTSFYDYRKDKSKLCNVLFLSFLVQFVRVVFIWSLGLSLGVKSEFLYYTVFIPLAQLGSMMPLSIAGLGIEEGAFIYFFSLVGENSATILGMGILSRILNICSVLPGGWLFLREGIGLKAKRNDQKGISPEACT
jgi:uncharacterized protein (TIRG00374 family)